MRSAPARTPSVLWYWAPDDDAPHPFRTVKTATYDHQLQERTFQTLGIMAMDDFGTLVPAGDPD